MFRSSITLSRFAAVLGAVLGATTLAACGSGSPQTSPARSSATPTKAQIQSFQSDAVRFSDCMRHHGIANFPDAPGANGAGGRTWKDAFQSNSPAFVAADGACQHFLPAAGQTTSSRPNHGEIVAMLAFARCIRARGVARFPDPASSSGITHEQLAQAGIDVRQPALARAAYACVVVTHGAITRGMVARFIAGH